MECYSTIEKLFSQISDRKKLIIDKAKQQADSFSQHLASKLLIDGITPPPCLLNPNLHFSNNSVPEDFKKDLLSELLLPHPQPTVVNRGGFFPPYSQPIVLEGKEKLEARVFGEIHGPTFLSDNNGNETRSALNFPEQGVSSTSLQGHNVVRTSDTVTEPANGEASKGFSFENLVSDRGCNAEDKSTPDLSFNDVGCALPFAFELDQSIISPQVQNDTRISSNVASRDQSVYKIQRSRSRQKALELRKTNEKSASTRRSDRNVSGVCFNEDEMYTNASNARQSQQEGELLASAKYFETTSHMCKEDQTLGECLSKEKDANLFSGRITRSRNSRNQSADDSKSKLDINLDVAQVDGEGTIRSHNSSVEGIAMNLHLSKSSSQRVTRSKSGPSEKFPPNYVNGQECHSQNAPSFEFNVSRPSIKDIIEQKEQPECLIGAEANEGSVEIQAVGSESKLDCAGPSLGLEGFDSRPSSNFMIVNPKTLDFDEIEKVSSIEVNTPMVEIESFEKSLGKRCESAKSHASLDKVTCSSFSAKSVEKQSPEKNILNQMTEPSGDSEEHVVEEEQLTKSATTKDVEDNSLLDGMIHNSPIHHGEQTRSSNSSEDIDMLNYQKKDEDSSLPNQQVQKCELSCNKMVNGDATTISSSIDNSNLCQVSSSTQLEADDGSTSVLDGTRCNVEETQNVMSRKSGVDEGLASSGSMLLHEKSSTRDDGFLARSAVESLHFDGKNFTSEEIRELNILEESLMVGKKLRSAAVNTWPKHKRRKIESQETKSISAGVTEKESHYIGASLNNRNLNDTGTNSGTTLQFESSPFSHEENAAQSDASKSPDVELHPEILTQETDSFPEMQIEQNELGFEEKIQSDRVPLCTPDGECVSFSASSLSTGEGKDPGISAGLKATTANATSTVLDESMQGSENDCENLVHFEDVLMENMDELSHYGRTLLEKDIVENGSHNLCPVVSPQGEHLTTSDSDQIMPEFEGFIIGEENSGQRHIVGDSFDSLELPASSVERASVLEQLCKSAVLHTPLNHFSATHKFHRTPDVYHSVPTLDANTEDEQISASQESHPDRIPFSDTHFGQNLTNPLTSPVSKLWTEFHPSLMDRSSSQSLSSENKLSLNPELVCFPIEEDPSFSEEREDKDEMANSTSEDICSAFIDCGDKRNPLTDITRENGDPLPPLSVAKVSRDRSSLDSVVSEVNFTGTHGGVRRKVDKRQSKRRTATNETKKKLTLSTSTNFMGIGKESLNNGNHKPNLSRKPSLRKDGPSMTGRESKQNNIISNISSFVPLVQQKQAAALITGKRDVKVKALEAAEAARRLEEKKDNERKLKKEALKLEQARVKQESLRQAELNRKKKEDELKKKEADVAARKRLREEEEKKEKERKRRRFEGKRQQQKEQDGKLRAQKLEKELPVGVINAKSNSVTVNADALQKPQKVKVDVDKGDGKSVKKPYAEFVASKSLENDVRQAVVEGFEAFGHSRASIEVAKTSRGKSYEISPYQSSDDEDDEDDEISPKKFVPAWASKKSLALIVSSQQNVDPDILFAPGSFCSVEEVSGLEAYNKK